MRKRPPAAGGDNPPRTPLMGEFFKGVVALAGTLVGQRPGQTAFKRDGNNRCSGAWKAMIPRPHPGGRGIGHGCCKEGCGRKNRPEG